MRAPTVRTMLVTLLVAAIAAVSFFHLLRLISDPDFFWHLKNGRWIWEHATLPSQDPFSFTVQQVPSARERAVLTGYVLSELVYYVSYLSGGMAGIILLRFVIVGLFVFVMLGAREGDIGVYLSLLAIVMVAILQIYAVERPHIFSFLFFGVLLMALKKMRAGDSRSRALPFLVIFVMLIWANSHVGFVLGQATIILVILTEGTKYVHPSLRPMDKGAFGNLAVVGFCAVLVSFLNPNTYHVWTEMVFQPPFSIVDNIEYQPTVTAFTIFHVRAIVLYWFVLFLTLSAMIIDWKNFNLTECALLLGTGAVSFFTLRYVPVFMIAALPMLGRVFSRTRRSLGAALAGIALVSCLVFGKGELRNWENLKTGQWIDSGFPVQAADFVTASGLRGNMYNYYNWGGYLIWRLAPERKVFIDGRCLDPGVVEQSILVETADSRAFRGTAVWKGILASHDVQFVMIPFAQPDGTVLPLFGALLKDPDWTPLFLSLNTAVFARTAGVNRDIIATRAVSKAYFLQAAIEVCDSFIRTTPADIFPRIAKGDLLLISSRFGEARAVYEMTAAIDPFNRTIRERLRLLSEMDSRMRRQGR